MGTAGRGMDLTTAALYSLVPGLSSKVVEEAGTPIAQAAIDKLGVTGANVKDNLDEIIEGINFFPYFKKLTRNLNLFKFNILFCYFPINIKTIQLHNYMFIFFCGSIITPTTTY